MINKENKNAVRAKRHLRVRKNIAGTAQCPRMNVYRSSAHIYAQLIDDETGRTLFSASTVAKDVSVGGLTKSKAAEAVGAAVAKKALAAGIERVVFDRGGYLYTGRIKALADGARSAGLQF